MLAHALCNALGLPRFWGRVGPAGEVGVELGEPIGPPEGAGKKDDDAAAPGGAPVGDPGLGVGWSVAYYGLLVGGAVGFYRLLFPLTESELELASFA